MKVQPFQVPKPLHKNLIVQVDKSKTFYKTLHRHNELQLSLIVKGTGKLIIGDSVHPFNDGEFYAIGANIPHVFKTETTQKEVHMISLFFTEHTFGANFFQLSDLQEIAPFFKTTKDGFQLLSHTKQVGSIMNEITVVSKLSRIILFLKLLSILCNAEKRHLTNFKYPKESGHLVGERMQVIFDYVLHNFHQQIKLQNVSSLIYMTPNAFCKFFKQHTNKSFFQFLIELRIEHACQLLLKNNTLSIAEIAELSGFKSISNFNRKFKAHKGIIPSSYHQKIMHIIAANG